MQRIKNLLKACMGCLTKVSKKAYSTCALVTVGVTIIAVMAMSRTDFGGSGKNRTIVQAESTYTENDYEEEENDAEISRYSSILTTRRNNLSGIVKHSLEEYSYLEEVQDIIIPREIILTGTKGTDNRITEEKDISMVDEIMIEEETTNKIEDISIEKENVTEETIAPPSQSFIENELGFDITEKDYEALLQIVEAEATNEDLKGRVLVANVITNRVKWGEFPNTIYEVIHQERKGKYQFSPLSDGRYYKVKVTDLTKEAVDLALGGVDYSNGALFFAARSMANPDNMKWFDTKLEFVLEYGIHEFFKYKE